MMPPRTETKTMRCEEIGGVQCRPQPEQHLPPRTRKEIEMSEDEQNGRRETTTEELKVKIRRAVSCIRSARHLVGQTIVNNGGNAKEAHDLMSKALRELQHQTD